MAAAAVAGSLAATRLGAQPSFPTWREIEAPISEVAFGDGRQEEA
jgi:sugar/nucleoside kinase (ribokinase family)